MQTRCETNITFTYLKHQHQFILFLVCIVLCIFKHLVLFMFKDIVVSALQRVSASW